MPRVPVYDQQQQLRPLPAGGPALIATADAFGGQQGQALQAVGLALNQASDRMEAAAIRLQERRDAETVRRAFVEFDNRLRAYLNDPERGALQRRGALAQGVTDEAFKTLDEMEAEVAAELTARQREAFAQRVMATKSSALDTLSRHEANEFRVVEAETTKAFLQGSIDSAATQHLNREAIDAYQQAGEAELRRMAALHGWTQDMLDVELGKYRTQLHKAVIERRVVDDPSGAREYYQAVQGDIDGTARTVLEKMLKDGVTRERAQRETDRIVASGAGYAEQLRMARAITDPELRDEVVRRVNARISEAEQLRRLAQDRNAEAAWGIIMQGGTQDDVPVALWSQLDSQAQRNILSYLDTRAKREQPDTDWDLYYRLQRLEPDALVSVPLIQYRAQLSDSEFTAITNLQRGYRDAMEKSDTSKLKEVASITQQLESAATLAGITSDKRKAQFFDQARAAFEREQLRLGRDLNYEERNRVIGELLIEGRKRRWLWGADEPWFAPGPKRSFLDGALGPLYGPKRPLYRVLAEDDLERWRPTDVPMGVVRGVVDGLAERGGPVSRDRVAESITEMMEGGLLRLPIPEAERAMVIEALQQRGEPVSEERILQIYARRVTRDFYDR